jgi:homoserine O-succinyltransferase
MIGIGQADRRGHDRPCARLSIGLVNNASDRAMKATEAQFLRMLRAASDDFDVNYTLFTCPEVPRSTRPLDSAGKPYAHTDDLFEGTLDALIVTGMEPRGKTLLEEPVWDSITRLVDWALENAVPVIWSCLAAHAAVLYLDGIARSRLDEKLSGAFACKLLMTDHALASGLPAQWTNPHSRYHDLSQAALAAHGYQILSSSNEAGVDVFLKEQEAPFLFFQGHPEYEADTVLREYKRDIRRYFLHESDEYPRAPRNYFDPATEAALAEARDRLRHGHRDLRDLETILNLVSGTASHNRWERPADALCRNWLALVARGSGRRRSREPWVNRAPFAQPRDSGAGLVQ